MTTEQPDCLHLLSSNSLNLRPTLAIATFPQRTDEYPETLTQKDFGPPRLTRSFCQFRRGIAPFHLSPVARL